MVNHVFRADLAEPVRDYLKQLAGQRVAYFPNPGNAGDSLIAAGTYQMLADLNISFDLVRPTDDVTGRIVLMGGGGNLVPSYGAIKAGIASFSKTAKLIVLLPHTIRSAEGSLRLLPKNSVIFCRDVASYEHVLDASNLANVFLSHDMAFNIDTKRLLNTRSLIEEARPMFFQRLKARQVSPQQYKNAGVVSLFRQDDESRFGRTPGLLDISTAFSFGVGPEAALRASWCMLSFLRGCDAVATDRLHVGIGAAILGKETHLFDNSYGKNYAVYRNSIRKITNTVTFYRIDGVLERQKLVSFIRTGDASDKGASTDTSEGDDVSSVPS